MNNQPIKKLDTEQIERLIKNGSLENGRTVIADFFDKIDFLNLQSVLLRLYISTDIYITAKSFANEIGISDGEFSEKFGSVDDIEKLSSAEKSVEYFTEMLLQCIRWRTEVVSKSTDNFSHKIKKFIENNYSKEELSLKDAADYMNFTPTYFSSLFKKEMGKNFVTYLTEIRVEKAKTLLCCTSKKVYEIAYDVGFGDYRYFSQIFKKHTGFTPQEFKISKNHTS